MFYRMDLQVRDPVEDDPDILLVGQSHAPQRAPPRKLQVNVPEKYRSNFTIRTSYLQKNRLSYFGSYL